MPVKKVKLELVGEYPHLDFFNSQRIPVQSPNLLPKLKMAKAKKFSDAKPITRMNVTSPRDDIRMDSQLNVQEPPKIGKERRLRGNSKRTKGVNTLYGMIRKNPRRNMKDIWDKMAAKDMRKGSSDAEDIPPSEYHPSSQASTLSLDRPNRHLPHENVNKKSKLTREVRPADSPIPGLSRQPQPQLQNAKLLVTKEVEEILPAAQPGPSRQRQLPFRIPEKNALMTPVRIPTNHSRRSNHHNYQDQHTSISYRPDNIPPPRISVSRYRSNELPDDSLRDDVEMLCGVQEQIVADSSFNNVGNYDPQHHVDSQQVQQLVDEIKIYFEITPEKEQIILVEDSPERCEQEDRFK